MAAVQVLDIRIATVAEGAEHDVRDEELAGLFERVAGGDHDALGPIYDGYAAELFAIAQWRLGSRADAADAVQDVFVKLATSPAAIAGVRHPRRYLLTMAHRAAVDRSRRRRPAMSLDEAPLLEAAGLDPDRQLDAARATAAVLELPESQRETIYLHHFAGLSFREIGRVTGVPGFTAASRYRLGMGRLRAILGATR